MLCKLSLQIFGCVYLELFSHDKILGILRQIFAIKCVNPNVDNNNPTFRGREFCLFVQSFCAEGAFESKYLVEESEARIGFDALAFMFLIFQLRVFHSWYFQHCMIDFRSEVILANRSVQTFIY